MLQVFGPQILKAAAAAGLAMRVVATLRSTISVKLNLQFRGLSLIHWIGIAQEPCRNLVSCRLKFGLMQVTLLGRYWECINMSMDAQI